MTAEKAINNEEQEKINESISRLREIISLEDNDLKTAIN